MANRAASAMRVTYAPGAFKPDGTLRPEAVAAVNSAFAESEQEECDGSYECFCTRCRYLVQSRVERGVRRASQPWDG